MMYAENVVPATPRSAAIILTALFSNQAEKNWLERELLKNHRKIIRLSDEHILKKSFGKMVSSEVHNSRLMIAWMKFKHDIPTRFNTVKQKLIAKSKLFGQFC